MSKLTLKISYPCLLPLSSPLQQYWYCSMLEDGNHPGVVWGFVEGHILLLKPKNKIKIPRLYTVAWHGCKCQWVYH